MRPAIGTAAGGNEDICSGQRLEKRSPGVVGVGPGAKTYPVKAKALRECGTASRREWAAPRRRWGVVLGGACTIAVK
jgi:hypothetical protein